MKKYDGRKWQEVYDYEFNNGNHWGYTEKNSRILRSQFIDVLEIGGHIFGTFDNARTTAVIQNG